MNIKVNNGQGIIWITASGMVECLIIQRPALAMWPDFQGSIGEYFSASAHTQEEKKNFTDTIDHFLLEGNEDQILNSIPDFMDLFANGDYEIRFGDINLQKTKFHKYHIFHYDGDTSKKVFYGSLYPYNDYEMFYTLHYNQINVERVDYYKKIIQDGARPKAIILCNSKSFRYYVLDGHHKIEAYTALGIDVPAVFITTENIESISIPEMMDLIYPLLTNHEFEHLLSINLPESLDFLAKPELTAVIDRILQNEKKISYYLNPVFVKYKNTAWLDERMNSLKKNIHLSQQGVKMYECSLQMHVIWNQIIVTHETEINHWIKNLIIHYRSQYE